MTPLTNVTVPLFPENGDTELLVVRTTHALRSAGRSDIVMQLCAEMITLDANEWDVLCLRYVEVTV
jgi:hypothetical protein